MGKTRDLFKKIGDIKGLFHTRRFTVKDRNGKDITEAETIKKRWQEYTEEHTKRSLSDPDNDSGVLTNLEPNILSVKKSSGLRKHHYKQS